MALAFVSCGGGDDVSKTVKGPAATPGASASAAAASTVKKAADMLPKLGDIGYETSNVQQLPTGGPGQEHIVVQYRKLTPPTFQARVEVYTLPDAGTAQSTFKSEVDAFTNPPPGSDLPGPNSANQRIVNADDSQSFVTTRPDAQGTLVWSDVYRYGNVVFIALVLGKDSPDAGTLRKTIGERIAALAK
jgi:hypothetical protein